MKAITYLTNPEYFGYYDDPTQKEPAYDPMQKAPCLICGKKWDMDNVRTICLLALRKTSQTRNGKKVFDMKETSWFYRVHKACDDKMSNDEKTEMEGNILESMEAN